MKIRSRFLAMVMMAFLALLPFFRTIGSQYVYSGGVPEGFTQTTEDMGKTGEASLTPYTVPAYWGFVETGYSENPAPHEKSLKQKLLDRQNLQIEHYVQGYMLHINSLTYLKQSHLKLRRLNI